MTVVNTQNRIFGLDLLRTYAIFTVVYTHGYSITRCSTFKPQPIAQKAKLGCPTFFPRNNPSYGQALCGCNLYPRLTSLADRRLSQAVHPVRPHSRSSILTDWHRKAVNQVDRIIPCPYFPRDVILYASFQIP